MAEHSSDVDLCTALRTATTHLESLQTYKVVGDQRSVLDYNRAHPPRVVGDWSAMYLQLNIPHALGTVPYRWDMGYSTARLLRVTLQGVSAVVLDAPWMPDGSVDGSAKAAAVKEALGIAQQDLLMAALGDRRQILVCRETEDQWEVVVPAPLLEVLQLQEETLMEFRPSPSPGGPDESRTPPEDTWRRFRDTDALADAPPPDWVCAALPAAPPAGQGEPPA